LFPVILKPATRYGNDRFTKDKAWQFNDRNDLLMGYDLARTLVAPSIIMIQEWIPGTGRDQYSYAALCRGGIPVAEIVTRRLRQYPIDFGKFSTLVEVIENPEILSAGRALVSHAVYTGLIEIEFKYDSEVRQYKLLDVNPRVWGWHTLGSSSGLDFAYLAWLMAHDKPLPEIKAVPLGAAWQYLFPDIISCAQSLARGVLPERRLRAETSVRRQHAIFAWDDLRPIILSGLALFAKVAKRPLALPWPGRNREIVTSVFEKRFAGMQKRRQNLLHK
jgi:predicted ATP-grasp superfamily ATP-dependent carboligase